MCILIFPQPGYKTYTSRFQLGGRPHSYIHEEAHVTFVSRQNAITLEDIKITID